MAIKIMISLPFLSNVTRHYGSLPNRYLAVRDRSHRLIKEW